MPRRLLLPPILATLLVLFLGCNGPDSRVRGAVQSGDSAAPPRALRGALHHAPGRAPGTEPSARAYQRAGILAERMGNSAVAIEYLNASLNAPPTRSERMAQIGLRWVDGLRRSLNASRLSRMLPDWVLRTLDVGRALLGRAAVDHEVTATALFATLVESGDTARALDLARARGWVQEGADYCAAGVAPRDAETRALVGM